MTRWARTGQLAGGPSLPCSSARSGSGMAWGGEQAANTGRWLLIVTRILGSHRTLPPPGLQPVSDKKLHVRDCHAVTEPSARLPGDPGASRGEGCRQGRGRAGGPPLSRGTQQQPAGTCGHPVNVATLEAPVAGCALPPPAHARARVGETAPRAAGRPPARYLLTRDKQRSCGTSRASAATARSASAPAHHTAPSRGGSDEAGFPVRAA